MNLAEVWNRSRTPEQEPVVLEEERPEPIDGESEWDFRHRCLAWLGFGNYESYLESKLWKSIRYRVMRNSGGICSYCKKPVQVVHHRRYTARGLQGTSDKWLVALCHECHEKQHRGWKRIEDSGIEIQVRKVKQLSCFTAPDDHIRRSRLDRKLKLEHKSRKTIRQRRREKIRQFQCAGCKNMLRKGCQQGEYCTSCRPGLAIHLPRVNGRLRGITGEHHF